MIDYNEVNNLIYVDSLSVVCFYHVQKVLVYFICIVYSINCYTFKLFLL